MKQPKSNQNLEATLVVQLLTAGTAACIADIVTFPLDTAKVRLQIQGELPQRTPAMNTTTPNTLKIAIPLTSSSNHVQYRGLVGTITTIAKQEGFKSLYNGLSAGLQRQMCFASVRLGMYDTVKTFYQTIFKENEQGLQLFTRILAGLTTGGMSVVLAQPTDVVKVRFQAAKNTSTSPRYTSTLQAYRTIGRDEGMRGLWKGAMPNIGRNAIVNVAEIVCYDVIKECLLQYTSLQDDIKCHFSAAVIAGFATTIAASPIDVVKTRYMNSPQGQYSGAIDCAVRMAKTEGALAFYKGFVPSFARLVSWNVVLWVTYEQMKILIFKPSSRDY